MIVMVFEVWPEPEHAAAYLDEAKALRPLADGIDGFLSIERFESLYEPGKILSLGFFRDEAAVTAWRNLPEHRRAQTLGRARYFRDYRLTMAEVSRRYGMIDRGAAPADSRAAHGGD